MGMSIAKRAGISRRVCPVILIVDASASMSGRPIGQLNQAIDNIVHRFAGLNRNNGNAYIKFAVLAFGVELDSVQWVTGDSLVDPDGYVWPGVETGGLTPMGKAFRELKEVLDRNMLLQCMSGSLCPVFMLFTDGYPTDSALSQLKALSNKRLFSVAQRCAVGFGEDADMDLLRKFVSIGKEEKIKDPDEMNKLIDKLAVHVNSGDIEKLAESIEEVTVNSAMLASETTIPPAPNPAPNPTPFDPDVIVSLPSNSSGSVWSK